MTANHTPDPALRYARQIALPDWGEQGQATLAAARVMVVGLGGLGSPVVTYLAGAGVGALTLNDFDRVDLSNLPRQPLHADAPVGALKTDSAARRVATLNPQVRTQSIDRRLDLSELTALAADHDLVVDASDNFGTRFGVNQACAAAATPLVSIAAIRYEGQLVVLDHGTPDAPCYACLYEDGHDGAEDCVGQGVMTPLVGVIGSLGALEALKILLGQRTPGPTTTVQCFDARTLSLRALTLHRRPGCPVCHNL